MDAGGRSGRDRPPGDWRWIVGIDRLGVVCGAHAASQTMLGSRHGRLPSVSSAAGFASSGSTSACNATEAAVVALRETLHAETLGTGVQVSVARPYLFRTVPLTTVLRLDAGPA